MDWILEHLQIVIAIAGAIAWWLNQRAKEKAGESVDYDGDGKPDVEPRAGGSMREQSAHNDEEERARQIMEEIRRKRAERAAEEAAERGSMPPPFPEPETAMPPPLWRRESESVTVPSAAETRRAEAEREAAAALERQRKLAEQLAELQARRAEVSRKADDVWRESSSAGKARAAIAARESESTLAQDLRDTRSLRKAIVLREVLGAPVGLR